MRLLRSALFGAALLALLAAPAGAKTIHFSGDEVAVPADRPVIRLAEHPRLCVRMDRRVVYLGRPASNQRCPSEAIGRSRAILIEPEGEAEAGASAIGAPAPETGGSDDYTGLGFDACTAPSSRAMAAWEDSPYRAIGVYIGGLNRACSQPNLTAEWVSEQVEEGWHLIPTYVGLQSPTSACTNCAKLSSGLASIQGIAAARDAVADAQEIGMGPGSPIYFDMEAYTRTSSATRATLTFLEAWTEQIHSLGYTSGVYSSSASGIADLVAQVGESYTLPDDLWFANWNGAKNADDPYVPADTWIDHQRIHQYRGGHDETWGGTTINIDNNYVEGATVGGSIAPPALPPLTVKNVRAKGNGVHVWVRCGWAEGESCPGQIILRTHARLPMRVRRGTPTRVVRLKAGHRTFRLGGGRAHTFRVSLDRRSRPLLFRRGFLKTQLLVAIPGSRAMRAVTLERR